MSNTTAIADGTFVGHAVASQFDPSVRLALNISESLLACKGFNGPDILSRHLFLFHKEKLEVGETTKFIYEYVMNKQIKAKRIVPAALQTQDFLFDQKTIDEIIQLTDEKLNGRTAGCGPAQRSFPLALCDYIADDDLFEVALKEAKLTHFNPIAGQVAGIINLIIRELRKSADWSKAVAGAFQTPNLHEDIAQVYYGYYRRPNLATNHQPGYAPAVLNAALYYTHKATNAGEAIAEAHANDKYFSSSLVGVLSGARWGIPHDLYKNLIKDTQLQILRTAANSLASIQTAKKNDLSC